VFGLYELAIGPHRPVFVSLLVWPDAVSLHQGWADIDGSPTVAGRRDAERSRYRRRLFAATEQYLLDPVRFPAGGVGTAEAA
jgi:hypothetical protein